MSGNKEPSVYGQQYTPTGSLTPCNPQNPRIRATIIGPSPTGCSSQFEEPHRKQTWKHLTSCPGRDKLRQRLPDYLPAQDTPAVCTVQGNSHQEEFLSPGGSHFLMVYKKGKDNFYFGPSGQDETMSHGMVWVLMDPSPQSVGRQSQRGLE